MTSWANFTADQVKGLASLSIRIGFDRLPKSCPNCDCATLKWYSYLNMEHIAHRFSYLWCSYCRKFHGERTAPTLMDLPDPFGNKTILEREAMESRFEYFFAILDEAWKEGILPQCYEGRV